MICLPHRLLLKDDKMAISSKQKGSKWQKTLKKLDLLIGENNNKRWIKGFKTRRQESAVLHPHYRSRQGNKLIPHHYMCHSLY